ncbi:MAG: hydrogenase nickel incorporation protein HypB [Candidatus Mcinerneyibacterium aminivorans]|uniref:Hydrogenase nickel incorporation protein HypB n=1 Tax=Candidatus Mcinerneyibacterium aminivorans TaxID=2703815 RepID=A0A5D0MJN4_9BACT|nr:MAG: hydrogenase nickel incorporation protein HypB [Candidatus Mcinerneyibacterium aminivorans]
MEIVKIGKEAMKKNENFADKNNKLLTDNDIFAVDVMGSVGSGKTSIIKQIIKKLKNKQRIGVIAGDLTTEIDARRIEEEGVPVIQIQTGRVCHLDAGLVQKAITKFNLADIDLLFIENVGNLICPAGCPIGAHMELVVTSVTEGPYMIQKHPPMFQRADTVAMNKIDFAEKMEISIENFKEDLSKINPTSKFVGTNGLTGEGVEELIECMNLPQ